MRVSRTHSTNSRVLPRSLPAPMIPSSQLDLAQWTLIPHYLTLKGKEGVFKIGRGITKEVFVFFPPVRASRGSQSSLRFFLKNLIFSESLISFCLHKSIMSLHLLLRVNTYPANVESALLYCPILLLSGIMGHVGHW